MTVTDPAQVHQPMQPAEPEAAGEIVSPAPRRRIGRRDRSNASSGHYEIGETPQLARGPVRLAARAVQVGAAALLGVLAVLPLWQVYGPKPDPVVVGSALMAAMTIPLLLRWWRRSGTTAVSLTMLGLAVYLSTALHRFDFVATLQGLTEGPAAVVTTTLPTPPTSLHLTPLIVLAWCSISAAVIPALWSRVPSAAIAGPLLVLTLASLLAAPARILPLSLVLAAAASALLSLAAAEWAQNPPTSSSIIRFVFVPTVLVLVAVLGAGAVMATQAWPAGRERIDLRDRREQPDLPDLQLSPIAVLGLPLEESLELFTIDGPAPQRVRIATLDRFDGGQWVSTGPFDRAGEELPLAAPVASNGVVVEHTIRLGADYRSIAGLNRWAPAPGSTESASVVPTRTDLDPLWVDSAASALLLPVGVESIEFTVQTRQSALDVGQDTESDTADKNPGQALADRRPAPGLGTHLALPGQLPASITAFSDRIPGSESMAPIERVLAVADILRERYANNPLAPPGHSTARLDAFLTDHRQGTPEQFAAALALIARREGVPARVAVGFEIDAADGAAASDSAVVTAGMLDAWVEIAVSDVGWLAIDPVPTRLEPEAPAPPSADREETLADPEGDAPEPESEPDIAPEPDEPIETGISLPRGLVFAGPLLLLGLGSIALVVGEKARRRRRRRRHDDPGRKVIGAWDEVRDRLQEAGVSIRADLSPTEQLRSAVSNVDAAVVAPVGAMVPAIDWAVYDTAGPSAEQADHAWAEVDAFRKRLSTSRSPRSRATALLDPRPLRRSR